jgi:hypothetical protein
LPAAFNGLRRSIAGGVQLPAAFNCLWRSIACGVQKSFLFNLVWYGMVWFWFLVFDSWYLVFGIWDLEFGIWYLGLGIWALGLKTYEKIEVIPNSFGITDITGISDNLINSCACDPTKYSTIPISCCVRMIIKSISPC